VDILFPERTESWKKVLKGDSHAKYIRPSFRQESHVLLGLFFQGKLKASIVGGMKHEQKPDRVDQ
jgi:hypothetical protein